MSRNASPRWRKDTGWDESEGCIDQRGWIVLYRESPTWQGLAVTSKSSTSLPVVGLDSWVRLIYVGCGRILIHCGVSLARSARYPIRPQSDLSLLDDTNSSPRTVNVAVLHPSSAQSNKTTAYVVFTKFVKNWTLCWRVKISSNCCHRIAY